MQRRAFERAPVNIKVRFFCCESHYDGTVLNLSERGMYISTDAMKFPFDSELDIIIPRYADILKVPVKVMRMTKSSDLYDGLGVEVVNASGQYLGFVNDCRKC